MAETRKVNVGIIGAGRIARVHTENLMYRIPEARVVAVADVIEEAAQKLAADFQIPAAHKDARAILADKQIDAVLICSSSDTHAQLIEDAAGAKKHIFCEKPIALDLAKIDHALQAVSQAGVKLQVGFNRRFDPSFKRVRELVASGEIGTPHLLRITSRDPAPPPIAYVKVSGGIFLDMAIHDFDMARYQMGSEVEEVFAAGSVLVDPEIGTAGDIDTAVVTLRFASGALGVIDNSRKAVYGYDQRVEVFGSKGMAAAGNRTPDTVMQSDATSVRTSKPLYFFLERYSEAFSAELREFVLSVVQDKMPPVTGVDGRIAVVIGYAALKSVKENRPVRVSEVDRK
ncbi:MAG: inositol 2-dehydrogenase [Chloroflexota bacterium]|nr:inositol 2-dehydrogenase [Chloroflexota bacterium]